MAGGNGSSPQGRWWQQSLGQRTKNLFPPPSKTSIQMFNTLHSQQCAVRCAGEGAKSSTSESAGSRKRTVNRVCLEHQRPQSPPPQVTCFLSKATLNPTGSYLPIATLPIHPWTPFFTQTTAAPLNKTKCTPFFCVGSLEHTLLAKSKVCLVQTLKLD